MEQACPFRRWDFRPGGPARRQVDIHCHCLPGVDDGPASLSEALALCRRLTAGGIATVVATPHQLGRYEGRNDAARIRRAVADLNRAVAAEGLPLHVVPGGEVRIDERVPELLAQDRILTVGDAGRYLLLELPAEALIPPVPVARELAAMGVATILAHPERCGPLRARPERLLGWLEERMCLQFNAASLLGAFGRPAERACWYWLGRGVPALVATDAHGGGSWACPSMAFAAIARRLGPEVAARVCIENPRRVLRAETLVASATACREASA